MKVGADKKKWKIVPEYAAPPPPPQYICILRSQRICIDLRNDGFGPEKAEIPSLFTLTNDYTVLVRLRSHQSLRKKSHVINL